MRTLGFLLFGAALVFGQAAGQEPTKRPGRNQTAPAKKDAKARPLIAASDLNKVLGQERVRLIDVGTDPKIYSSEHIPGSVFVHWINDMTDPKHKARYNLAPAKKMQSVLRRLGIRNDDQIVISDNLFNRLSTRLYWSLKSYGHRNVKVLDGGIGAWKAAGLKVTTEVPKCATSEYRIGKADPRISANLDFIRKRLGQAGCSLVDGRPPQQFSGAEPGRVFHTGAEHKMRGHVPDAINIFWKENFKSDGTFKSAKELRALYEKRGIIRGEGKVVVTYCNEGLHAVPPWFVLSEILGYKDVRVYDDSMAEWANSDQPMETGSGRKAIPKKGGAQSPMP